MIKSNLDALRGKIAEICGVCGRNSAEITLVGVTKYSQVEDVQEALRAGLTDIAENRVQAAREKFIHLNAAGVRKHLIGHLQSNKARDAVALFDLIHSVDSVELLREINKRAAQQGKVQDILLQVDIAKEEQKFGLPEQEVTDFADEASKLAHVRLMGLMTMAPLTEDRELIRSVFRRCREISRRAFPAGGNIQMKYLSMGMSHDYDIALEEGANMLRIGSLIFK